ncbi:MAG: HIT family protein [Micrococcales bacterium]|nr:HIT family protein [Micrococcales bacterium]
MACVFCAIVAGESEAALVAETESALAFLDSRPLFPGHALVVPRTHVPTLPELPAPLLAAVMGLAQQIAAVMPAALGAQGTFVAMNNVVSQSVPHLHVHVVPRTKGDGLRGFFWPRHPYASAEEMQGYAARLRAALP